MIVSINFRSILKPSAIPLILLTLLANIAISFQCLGNTEPYRAVIQHFNRKSIGGGAHCPYLAVGNPKHIAVANNLGLLLFDGNEWALLDLPNGAQARSVASMDDILYCGGQGFVGILNFDSLSSKTEWIDCTPQIQANSGPFEDVWRMFVPPPHQREAAKEFAAVFSCRQFGGALDSEGNYTEWMKGPIRNAAEWSGGIAFQSADSIHLFDWSGTLVSKTPITFDWKMEGIIRTNDEQLLILTHQSGLWEYNGFQWQSLAGDLDLHLKMNGVNCMEARKDHWLIGTTGGGIVSTSDFRAFRTLYTIDSDLTSNSVLDMKTDAAGNIWVGLEGGVDVLKYNWPHRTPIGLEKLQEPGYSSLHLANGKRFWGTSRGVYSQENEDEPLEIVMGTSGPTWSLSEQKGDVWACNHFGAGVIQNGQFHEILPGIGVWKIWPSTDPTLWYAGTYSGIFQIKYDPRARHPKSRWLNQGKLDGFDESARFLFEEKKGVWWVSHPYKGAFRLQVDEERHMIQSIRTYNESSGFPAPLQINMCALNDSMIFATSRGFYRWNEKSDLMVPDSSALNRWFDDQKPYQRIYNNPKGDIWIFDHRSVGFLPLGGLSVITEPSLRFASMAQNPAPTPFEAIEFLSNGEVCIPVEQGFTYLTPGLMQDVKTAPRVTISNITHLTTEKSVLRMVDQSIQLDAGVHALEFKLAGLNSNWAGLTNYQWRIKNVSETWSRPTSNGRITLSGLQPGQHQVEFRPFIGEHLQCTTTPLTIVVNSYWYQKSWVRILIALFSISLVMMFFQRNKRILEADHMIQKQKEHENRLEMELSMRKSMEQTEMALQAQKSKAKELQLANKNQELASATMHLVQKAQLVQTIDSALQSLKKQLPNDNKSELDALLKMIKDGGKLDDAWDSFTRQFDQVHVEFHNRIKEQFPQLTKTDLKLCTYLRMNLSSKEIASLMYVSLRAVEVSRSRLRKRLGLSKELNLLTFIQNI